MHRLNTLFEAESNEWLQSLPSYQRRLVEKLLSETQTPQEAAAAWLAASPRDTFPFGAIPGGRPFLEKLEVEIEALICGDPRYNSERAKLLEQFQPTHSYLVGALSVAIAPAVGSSATFIAPAVALVLVTAGKCTVNAWCAYRKELRIQKDMANENRPG